MFRELICFLFGHDYKDCHVYYTLTCSLVSGENYHLFKHTCNRCGEEHKSWLTDDDFENGQS